jgi:hypothetical protein
LPGTTHATQTKQLGEIQMFFTTVFAVLTALVIYQAALLVVNVGIGFAIQAFLAK